MAFIGQGVARTFVKFEPLEAYKLDLIGSVLGIVGFSALVVPPGPAARVGRGRGRRDARPRAAAA